MAGGGAGSRILRISSGDRIRWRGRSGRSTAKERADQTEIEQGARRGDRRGKRSQNGHTSSILFRAEPVHPAFC